MLAAGLVVILGCKSPARRDDDPARPVTATAIASDAPVVTDAQVIAASPPDAAPKLAIVDAPIKWSAQRAALTLAYRQKHSDAKATDLVITPRVIVLHYTSGGSSKGTREYFDNLEIEASRPELARAGRVNVSSHYLIDRDGTIYRLQPETQFARHCIGLNHIAIGIENVGDEKRWPLTDAQVTANAALVRELAGRFEITHLLGHYEVKELRKHPYPTGAGSYFVELDPSYKNDKPDPGVAFMKRVRAEVADLALAGLP